MDCSPVIRGCAQNSRSERDASPADHPPAHVFYPIFRRRAWFKAGPANSRVAQPLHHTSCAGVELFGPAGHEGRLEKFARACATHGTHAHINGLGKTGWVVMGIRPIPSSPGERSLNRISDQRRRTNARRLSSSLLRSSSSEEVSTAPPRTKALQSQPVQIRAPRFGPP